MKDMRLWIVFGNFEIMDRTWDLQGRGWTPTNGTVSEYLPVHLPSLCCNHFCWHRREPPTRQYPINVDGLMLHCTSIGEVYHWKYTRSLATVATLASTGHRPPSLALGTHGRHGSAFGQFGIRRAPTSPTASIKAQQPTRLPLAFPKVANNPTSNCSNGERLKRAMLQ